MSDQYTPDSKDESGEHPAAVGDVAPDLTPQGRSTAVPDRKVRVLCPYCGRGTTLGARCEQCKGLLDPLSRQATQNSMGPWFIHDPQNPFRPGCSYEVIQEQVRRGRIVHDTVLRGPTTRQYWMIAGRAPSIANLLGKCHNCQHTVDPAAVSCPSCGADFSAELDRQFMGLGPVHLLPGQSPPEEVAKAARASAPTSAAPHVPHVPHAPHAQAGAHHDQTQAHTTSSAKAAARNGGPPARDTGEYRALLSRMERLDRELGTTRAMLIVAGITVLLLIGAVVWTSGVFGGGSSPQDAWPTPTDASGTNSPAAPAGSGPASNSATAPNRDTSPEDEPQPTSMPPDPAREDQPASEPDPAAAPVEPQPQESPKSIASAPEDARAKQLAAEWALLRGLP